jgi:hypothetical protein
MQRVIGLSVGLVLAIGFAWYAWNSRTVPEEHAEYHVHAAFQVYQDNNLQDYSELKFQHLRPCTANDEGVELSAEEEQQDTAHLHQGIGDVVHVHRETATWADLFFNLKVELGEPITGYVNGQAVENILDQPIRGDDRVLILVGENNDIQTKLDGVPAIEHIRDVERAVETC